MSYIDRGLYLILGESLKAARDASQLTLAEAASKIGVTTMTIQRYEKAERKASVETIRQLCVIYGVSADNLMQEAIDKFRSAHNDSAPPSAALSDPEQELVDNFRQLNDEGQDKLIDYSSDLVALGKYKKYDISGVVAETA